MGYFFYGEIKIRALPGILKEVGISSSIVLFIIASASAVTWVLAYLRLPQQLAAVLPTIFPNPTVMLLGLSVIFLIAGTFIDVSPGVILFGPILLPAIKAVGADPVHFTVIMVFALAIGLFTPPVGTTLFLSCHIAKTEILPTVKETIPFFFIMTFVLILIVIIPQLVMWIPSLVR